MAEKGSTELSFPLVHVEYIAPYQQRVRQYGKFNDGHFPQDWTSELTQEDIELVAMSEDTDFCFNSCQSSIQMPNTPNL